MKIDDVSYLQSYDLMELVDIVYENIEVAKEKGNSKYPIVEDVFRRIAEDSGLVRSHYCIMVELATENL